MEHRVTATSEKPADTHSAGDATDPYHQDPVCVVTASVEEESSSRVELLAIHAEEDVDFSLGYVLGGDFGSWGHTLNRILIDISCWCDAIVAEPAYNIVHGIVNLSRASSGNCVLKVSLAICHEINKTFILNCAAGRGD